MAKRQRSRKEQLAEVIRESHEQWKRLRENGGNDPFWTDGVNLNLVRNHIIYGRRLCEEELQEGDYPEEYYLPVPEKVSDDFMAKESEISKEFKRLLNQVKQDPDYIWLEKSSEEKAKRFIQIINGYEEVGKQHNLVAMRRLASSNYSDRAHEIRKELENLTSIVKEKVLPEGQLTIFDLFSV